MPPAREVVPSVTCCVSSRSISVLLIFIYHILSISHIITKSSGTFYKVCHCINGISPSLKLPPTEKQLAQQLPQRRTPCWGENSKYLNTSVTICSSDDRFLEVQLLGQKPGVFTHFWWSSYCQIPLERWSVLRSTPSLGQPWKTLSTLGQLKIHKEKVGIWLCCCRPSRGVGALEVTVSREGEQEWAWVSAGCSVAWRAASRCHQCHGEVGSSAYSACQPLVVTS